LQYAKGILMASTQTELGHNRTGVATSPKLTQEMLAGAQEFAPAPNDDENTVARVREEYARDADPLGSVPPPATLTGAAKAALRGAKGLRPTQFIDKLGERLAFERTGVRLYGALISKLDAFGSFDGGPTREALVDIMNEEHQHFTLLTDAVAQLGGDPTVVTPSADLHATMTAGVMAVMVDPRTTFVQCLEAALIAELADNAAWEVLSELATRNGEDDLAAQFETARNEEVVHLDSVKRWLAMAQKR
jgi:rubrerythrin